MFLPHLSGVLHLPGVPKNNVKLVRNAPTLLLSLGKRAKETLCFKQKS